MSYLKTKDVAKLMNVSVQTIRTLAEKGDLEAVRVGCQLRIDEEAFRRYMHDHCNLVANVQKEKTND